MNSFDTLSELHIDGARRYQYYSLERLEKQGFASVSRLPYSLRVLLENLLRNEDAAFVDREDISTLANWDPRGAADYEIAFRPARVLLQDFTGVPCVADLAAMRDAVRSLGGDPARINPLCPVELVIDHSVQVDSFGTPSSFRENASLEFARNKERYQFLRWAQKAFRNFTAIPPDTGIVHQVNLEMLARVVFVSTEDDPPLAYPDTLVGTDSHTTMINGIGVLGWGVGGIEAEAAMLGQPISMLIPQVVGFKLKGQLSEGVTATDLVLTVTEMLRKKGVVGRFVEFFGPGLDALPVADRATIANMAPEYGATMGIFPVDEQTLKYLRLTGRSAEQVQLVERYTKAQGLFRTADTKPPQFFDTLELDLASVEPSLAGPHRPQDRVPLKEAKQRFEAALVQMSKAAAAAASPAKGGKGPGVDPGLQLPVISIASPHGMAQAAVPETAGVSASSGAAAAAALAPVERLDGMRDGSVVIAAITSCTNTSNPSVLIAAGLLAKKAVERGLDRRSWVKTSLAPGSKAVTEYLNELGLSSYLEKLGFYLVGYGCTTCIGNSGPLPDAVAAQIKERKLVAVAVLSGNRNFEGRIQPLVRANYLASPPLVVAYALAGRMDIDLLKEPLGTGRDGQPVFLRDLWPTQDEVQQAITSVVRAELFQRANSGAMAGDDNWKSLPVPEGDLFAWERDSTYIRRPPFFDNLAPKPPAIRGARVLAVLGDSITTDHISPAGSIPSDSPAARFLLAQGVEVADFNSFGARRGNHEVMVRGTFGNIRLRNQLVPGTEGNWTMHFTPAAGDVPAFEGTRMTIYDAAMEYARENVPLIVLAGKEYGSGSSRDWAAKGVLLLGVRAVIAESYERIHRSNLVGMGVLPLEFKPGESIVSLGLTGHELYEIEGVPDDVAPRGELTVRAGAKRFQVVARIDTPQELLYYKHGGILPYVLRQLLGPAKGV